MEESLAVQVARLNGKKVVESQRCHLVSESGVMSMSVIREGEMRVKVQSL